MLTFSLLTVNQGGNPLAKSIEDFQFHIHGLGKNETDGGYRVERIGIVVIQTRSFGYLCGTGIIYTNHTQIIIPSPVECRIYGSELGEDGHIFRSGISRVGQYDVFQVVVAISAGTCFVVSTIDSEFEYLAGCNTAVRT